MRPLISRILLVLCAVTMFVPVNLLAQSSIDSRKIPLGQLKSVKPKTDKGSSAGFASAGIKKNGLQNKSFAATKGLPGVDSLANWSDEFTAPGYDPNGNSESVWQYTMVGTPPETGQTTAIQAPIVPMELDLLGPNGQVASYKGHPLVFTSTPDIVGAVLNSPVFLPVKYNSGYGQFNDEMMRASFWNRTHRFGDDNWDNGWHTLLIPGLKKTRKMQIPYGSWYFFVDGNDVPVAAAVEGGVFSSVFFPPTFPIDNSTPIGAAELAGDITTKTMATFLFNNVFLYDTTIDNCCVLGFHSYDYEPGVPGNGNRERRYVLNFSSWLSPGFFAFGFEDITPWSHELAETFADPFVDNVTPWWLSVDPVLGYGQCQDILEVGDVIEVLTSNAVFPIALSGRTYHPQNETLMPWFEFQSPSKAYHGSYSFPDETTLLSLSPGPLLPGCQAP